jgi:uncharacterized protein
MSTKKTDLIEKNQTTKNYSGYGSYQIQDKLELKLPKTEILFERKSDNQFSYYRKNSENKITNKLIPRKGKDLQIELAPILPLNLPQKKTDDLMFLRLANSVFVEKQSQVEFLVQFPIEIGVFIINPNDGSKDFFDCFTCEPMHSRFGLYGIPDGGKLCMYSKVAVLDKHESDEYIFAIIKVSLDNQLDHGMSIGKLVFPVSYHDIYYLDGKSEAHIDDIKATIKNDINKEVIDIIHVTYSKKNSDWKLAPRSEPKSEKTGFTMDKGFD